MLMPPRSELNQLSTQAILLITLPAQSIIALCLTNIINTCFIFLKTVRAWMVDYDLTYH